MDGIAFLFTMRRKLNFVTIDHTHIRTGKALVKHITQVLQVYIIAAFNVRYVMMNGEFKKAKDLLSSIVCNTTAAKEHVAETEREIRMTKVRNRRMVATQMNSGKGENYYRGSETQILVNIANKVGSTLNQTAY